MLGVGEPGTEPFHSWTDQNPISGIQHVGLGSWDKHVCFRNIDVRAPLEDARGQFLSLVILFYLTWSLSIDGLLTL